MLLNGGSRSALRSRSSNDENAVVGGKSSSKGGGGLGGAGAGGAGGGPHKPTVRLALGPAKSLDANGGGIMNGAGVAKTPGPSNARRRAFGDISNRKAGRGPGNGNAAAAGAAKTPKAVSFQSNLFGPPTKTPGNGNGGGGLGGGGGGKSAKKKGLQLQLQQQRTPFASRNRPNASANPNRSVVSFEPSSSNKFPPIAVMPTTSSRKASSRESAKATSAVQDKVIDEDAGSISSVELPAGGRIWDPSDFFYDDDSYDLAARVAAVNTSLDDPSFVMPTFPAAAAVDGEDRLLAKAMEELGKEEYETLDHLLNDFAPEDVDGEDDLLSGLTPPLDTDDDDFLLLDDLDDLAVA